MKSKQEKSVIEQLGQTIRESIIVKVMIIFILTLILMIPMSFIQKLIQDREELQQSSINDINQKWANRQYVYGPVITVPIKERMTADDKIKSIRQEVHLLPSTLTIHGQIDPLSLHRGIYEVVVYNSEISFAGKFSDLNIHLNEIEGSELLWDEAFITINISDLRGIKKKIVMNWNGNEKQVEPGTHIPALIKSGITVDSIFDAAPSGQSFDFSFKIQLQGSQFLGFAPLGKETNVYLNSEWQDPSFTGSFLPDDRQVNDAGFTADYNILELNRNYPQFWIGDQNAGSIEESAFGVELLVPVNDYRKAMRSAKYALLIISLTFLTFFLIEIFSKIEMHPFQYTLIGLALCLFYTLLISISEHTSFNTAYLISGVLVIALIGFYSRSIFKNIKHSILLMLILCLEYAFVFFTLQVQDYSLLIGSIGLTLVLALTMYFTRHIDWFDTIGSVKDKGIT